MKPIRAIDVLKDGPFGRQVMIHYADGTQELHFVWISK